MDFDKMLNDGRHHKERSLPYFQEKNPSRLGHLSNTNTHSSFGIILIIVPLKHPDTFT
jgi:hypothetical protein